MANTMPLATRKALFQGQVNVLGATLRAIPVDSALWTPAPATNAFVSDIPSGATTYRSDPITNPTLDTSSGSLVFDADDAIVRAVPANAPSAELVVLFVDTGTDSTSRILLIIDTDPNGASISRSFTGDDVLVQWAPAGIVVL